MGDIRWFHYLNKKDKVCLAKSYPISSGLVVRYEQEGGNNLYAWFRNHIDFSMKTRSLPKRFHEVITGRQKIRFDFDKVETQDQLYQALEDVYCNVNKLLPQIKPENMLFFTSHSKSKLSAHLIVNGFYYRNSVQCKAFFDLLCKNLQKETVQVLDDGVYSNNQCFRILGSSKYGEQRPKIYRPFVHGGKSYPFVAAHEEMYEMELLRASLISHVEGCQLLPDLIDEEKPREEVEIEIEEVKRTLSFVRKKLGEFPYKVRQIEGNKILLTRVRPSYCISCRRVHEKENPFLILNCIDVYFCCRRGKCKFLGQLGEDDQEPLPFEEGEEECDQY